jgi:hypothetical protein
LLRDFNAFWRRKFQDLIDRYAAHITSNCIREPRIPADLLPDTQRCLSLHTCSRDEEVASLLTKVAPLAYRCSATRPAGASSLSCSGTRMDGCSGLRTPPARSVDILGLASRADLRSG